MKGKDPKDLLKQGWIHLLVTFEVVGKPPEHVKKSLQIYLDEVKKDERVVWMEEHIGKPEKTNDDFFGAFAEVDMLVKDMDTISWITIGTTPASIEVIEPSKLTITALDLQNWTNDLLTRLHQIGLEYKGQTTKIQYLRNNLTMLLHNTILISLSRGAKKLPELEKDTSIIEATLKEQLDFLVKEKKVAEKKGVYSLP